MEYHFLQHKPLEVQSLCIMPTQLRFSLKYYTHLDLEDDNIYDSMNPNSDNMDELLVMGTDRKLVRERLITNRQLHLLECFQ